MLLAFVSLAMHHWESFFEQICPRTMLIHDDAALPATPFGAVNSLRIRPAQKHHCLIGKLQSLQDEVVGVFEGRVRNDIHSSELVVVALQKINPALSVSAVAQVRRRDDITVALEHSGDGSGATGWFPDPLSIKLSGFEKSERSHIRSLVEIIVSIGMFMGARIDARIPCHVSAATAPRKIRAHRPSVIAGL